MLIYLLVFSVIYMYVRSNINYFYFEPGKKRDIEEYNKLNYKYPCVKINNHYALYKKGLNANKVMIISHGNAGSFLDMGYMIDKLEKYSGDIYLFEYPGFSGINGTPSITNCVNELLFWIFYLKSQYAKIDLFGTSIGGGIIAETCSRNSLNFINKIYLQSTFTSMRDVIRDLHPRLYILYNILLLDDLNTSKSLKNISCNKYVIIHSPDDQVIKYEQAEKNFLFLQKLKKQVKFIKGTGEHGNTLFELKKIEN
jgi:hypothetical protein